MRYLQLIVSFVSIYIAKKPTESQYSENQSYNEEEITHQSPAGTIVEENVESQQVNQYFGDDDMVPQDNLLNEQRLQVQTVARTDYSNDDQVQDNNTSNVIVSTSCIPARVTSSQSTIIASVGTVSPSASHNKENEQMFHSPVSPSSMPIQPNPSQLLQPSQTAQINQVSEVAVDQPQENDQVLHKAKRFKVGETGVEIDLT